MFYVVIFGLIALTWQRIRPALAIAILIAVALIQYQENKPFRASVVAQSAQVNTPEFFGPFCHRYS